MIPILYDFDGQPHLFDGAALRRLRYRHGMVQLQLAHALHTYPGTIGKWETGSNYPTHEQAKLLREILGKDAWEVFKGVRYVRKNVDNREKGETQVH